MSTFTEQPSPETGHTMRPCAPRWIHFCAWGGVFALALLLIMASHHYEGKDIWNGWPEAKGLRQPSYMERIYPEDFLRTRANSWSNLAYVLLGFYAIGLGIHDLRCKPALDAGHLTNTPPMSFLFGAMCCYLGFGSGFFHASLTRIGQQVDVAAMYAPLFALIAISLGGWIQRTRFGGRLRSIVAWLLALVVLIASYLLFKFKWSMSSAVVLSALILVVAVLALLEEFIVRQRKTFWWLIFSALALVGARICWEMDVAKKFSGPDTFLQGHAIWHLLTALSLASMYFYYRVSSRNENPHPH